MLICENCRNIYTEENAKVAKQDLFVEGEYIGTEEYLVCKCGGWLVEAKICPACERIYIQEDEDICGDCYNEAQDLDTCLKLGEEEYNDVSVAINGFLAMVYDKDEIERCLLNDFEKLPSWKQQEYIKEYLDGDLGYLADWMGKKRKGE